MPISNQQHQLQLQQQHQHQQQQLQQKQNQNQGLKSNLNQKNVSKLYDLCIKNLIKNNLSLIITKQHNNLKLSIKLPSTICDSILAEYFIEYENKIKILERNEYFMLNKLIRQQKKCQQMSEKDVQIENIDLISSYDLLKCFSSEASISTAIYKQCLRVQTPLNDRLKKLLKTKTNILTPKLNDHINKIVNLRSTSNPNHLSDSDLEIICKNKIEYLDICPCMLTNRVIGLINSNLKCLKYLKLQNYCEWTSENGAECGRLFKKSIFEENMELSEDDDEENDEEYACNNETNNNNVEMNENIDYIDDFEDEDEEIVEQKVETVASTSSSSSSDQEEYSYSRLLRHYHFLTSTNINSSEDARSTGDGITANIQELLKNLLNRKLFRTSDDVPPKQKKKKLKINNNPTSTASNLLSLLPLWVSRHIDLINNKTTEATTSTAAAASANPTEMYENLNDFFLNEQKSTYMNEEEVAKYLLNLELLAKKQDDDDDDDDDDDYYSDSERPLDKQLKYLDDDDDDEDDDESFYCVPKISEQLAILNLENLQYLSFKGLDNCLTVNNLNDILVKFKQLKYLDLTSCFKSGPLDIMGEVITPKPNLSTSLKQLIFSNFNPDELVLNLKFILSLRNLNYLDISNYREKNMPNVYKNSSYLLAKLVFYLKNLHSIDISGTNLGGPDLFNVEDEIKYIKTKLLQELDDNDDVVAVDEDFKNERNEFLKNLTNNSSKIIGLLFLNCKKLNFLGCLNCDQNVSGRENLPALHIAGEAKEQYLFTCLEVYMDKPLFILDSLNYLFESYKEETIKDKLYGGYLVMNCMQKYLNNPRIQISGSASLFYVLKYTKDENKPMAYFYLKRLIETIMNAIEEHIDESPMRRNCVLIMCRMNLPDDVLFVSDRLINVLLKIFDDYIENKAGQRSSNAITDRSDNFILRTAMHLLNILACSVHGSDKTSVGALAIPVAMDLIKTKLQQNDHDDILEVTWSFLWNITGRFDRKEVDLVK
jgi:hypothetical protein